MNSPSDFQKYQKEGYDSLIRDLKNGDLIIITGTGLSVAVTKNPATGSWAAFLQNGIEYCIKHGGANVLGIECDYFLKHNYKALEEIAKSSNQAEKDVKKHYLGDISNLSTDEIKAKIKAVENTFLLDIGDIVTDYLTDVKLMSKWLREQFKGMKIKDNSLILSLNSLQMQMATTNYDSLIEKVIKAKPITWEDDIALLQNFVKKEIDKEKLVLHLHGHYATPKSIVLGSKSYQNLINKGLPTFVESTLGFTNSFLLVGFGGSADDPNFSFLFNWLQNNTKQGNVYILSRSGEVYDNFVKQYQGKHDRVYVLVYGDNYDKLPNYFHKIAKDLPFVTTFERKSPLIGQSRKNKLDEIVDFIKDGPNNPICILGAPGIGKSNLIENIVASRSVELKYASRRFMIDCEPLNTYEDLLIALYQKLYGDSDKNVNELQEAIKSQLIKKRTLLVLDGLEKIWEQQREEVESFLSSILSHKLQLIVGVRGREAPVGILWEKIEIEPLEKVESFELFNEITKKKYRSDSQLDSLITDMDGHPLSLLLLANQAQLQGDSLNILKKEWELLHTELLTDNSPIQNKRNSFDTLVRLALKSPRLDKRALEMMSLIAKFPLGVSQIDLLVLFKVNNNAIKKLTRTGLCYIKAERVMMLMPIRQFVMVNYKPNGRDWHKIKTHYLELPFKYGSRIGFVNAQEGLSILRSEWLNIEYIISQNLEDVSALDGLSHLTRFLANYGDYATSIYEKALQQAKQKSLKLQEANLSYSVGLFYFLRHQYEISETYYKRSCKLFDELGLLSKSAKPLTELGEVYFFYSFSRKDISDKERAALQNNALRYFKKAIAYTKKKASNGFDPDTEDLKTLGIAYQKMGKLWRILSNEEREKFYVKAINIHKSIGHSQGIANCEHLLGLLFKDPTNPDFIIKAKSFFEEALSGYTEIGSESEIAQVQLELADILLFEQSNLERALQLYEKARASFASRNSDSYVKRSSKGVANTLVQLAKFDISRNQLEEAKKHFSKASDIYKSFEIEFPIEAQELKRTLSMA
jgi:tetratricopeptide (TPR) repeat protein